jgi:hypothetical protein
MDRASWKTGEGFRWQRMGLPVVGFLEPVFGFSKKAIGSGEFATNRLRYKSLFAQRVQHGLDGWLLECRQDAAPDQLEHLGEKLDFPDTAAPSLMLSWSFLRGPRR